MLSTDNKMRTVHCFDTFCKKVMRFEARTCYKSMTQKQQREISLDYLMEERHFEASALDDYFMTQPMHELQTHFCVRGHTVAVENERLALALMQLSEQKRNFILLLFFLGFKEKEIAAMYGLQRHTFNYHKNRSLKLLRQEMERMEHEAI